MRRCAWRRGSDNGGQMTEDRWIGQNVWGFTMKYDAHY